MNKMNTNQNKGIYSDNFKKNSSMASTVEANNVCNGNNNMLNYTTRQIATQERQYGSNIENNSAGRQGLPDSLLQP
jgi:hypothetical protein